MEDLVEGGLLQLEISSHAILELRKSVLRAERRSHFESNLATPKLWTEIFGCRFKITL